MIQRASLGILLAICLTMTAYAAELRLTITGVHFDRGELLIGLYDNPNGFGNAVANASNAGIMPDPGRLVGVSIRARPGPQSTIFYAVAAGAIRRNRDS